MTTNVEREQLNKHGSKYDTSKEQLEERNTNLDGINSDSDVEALVTATCIQSENEMVLQPGYGYINYQVAQDNKYGNAPRKIKLFTPQINNSSPKNGRKMHQKKYTAETVHLDSHQKIKISISQFQMMTTTKTMTPTFIKLRSGIFIM